MFIRLRTTRTNQFSRSFLPCMTLLILVSLSACTAWLPNAYRQNLQQGNTIKLTQIKQLKMGMSKAEVHKILGSPILADPFHNQRWDYIYRFIPGHGAEKESRLTLFFNHNRLKKIDAKHYVDKSYAESELVNRSSETGLPDAD